MFVKAWIEPQSSVPNLKRPSASLFYVLGRGDLTSSGLDVDVALIDSRADSLHRALKEGPFPNTPSEGKTFLHLCSTLECVGQPALNPGGGAFPPKRVHAVAIHVYFRAELTEKWYSEGLKELDRNVGKTSDLPAYAISGAEAEEARKTQEAKKKLVTGVVGGTGSLPLGNPLGVDASKHVFTSSMPPPPLPTPTFPPPASGGSGIDVAASAAAQAEHASLRKAQEQAQASIRAMEEAIRKMQEATADSIRQQRELATAQEAAKARVPPGQSQSRKRSRQKSRKKERSPSRHSRRDRRSKDRKRSRGSRRHSKPREASRRPSERREPAAEKRPRRASPRTEARTKIPTRPTIQVPGLSTGGFGDALLDRKPGIYGALSPYFKADDVIAWIQAQTAYSDAVRVQLLAVQRAERRRRHHRRSRDRSRKKRKHSSHSRSRSSHSRSSSGAGEREKERERFKFRLIAKEKPGVTFATMVANSRQALGHFGVELDVGTHGPLFRKRWESSYTKDHSPATLKPYLEELQLLVTVLDEFYAGRMIEVGDILASRLRYLTAGIDKNCFKAARHFLVYHMEDTSLVSEAMMDQALRIEENDQRRQKRMATARGGGHRER